MWSIILMSMVWTVVAACLIFFNSSPIGSGAWIGGWMILGFACLFNILNEILKVLIKINNSLGKKI